MDKEKRWEMEKMGDEKRVGGKFMFVWDLGKVCRMSEGEGEVYAWCMEKFGGGMWQMGKGVYLMYVEYRRGLGIPVRWGMEEWRRKVRSMEVKGLIRKCGRGCYYEPDVRSIWTGSMSERRSIMMGRGW